MTAGVAAPAYAGIPVTHRDAGLGGGVRHRPRGPGEAGDARSTGRRWPRFPGTLVFYMGVGSLPGIAERLIAAGRPADEPAAVIERGTLPGPAHACAPRWPRSRRACRRGDPRAGRSRGRRRSAALAGRAGLAGARAAARPGAWR